MRCLCLEPFREVEDHNNIAVRCAGFRMYLECCAGAAYALAQQRRREALLCWMGNVWRAVSGLLPVRIRWWRRPWVRRTGVPPCANPQPLLMSMPSHHHQISGLTQAKTSNGLRILLSSGITWFVCSLVLPCRKQSEEAATVSSALLSRVESAAGDPSLSKSLTASATQGRVDLHAVNMFFKVCLRMPHGPHFCACASHNLPLPHRAVRTYVAAVGHWH